MSIAFALLARYWQYVVMALLLAVIGGQRLALKWDNNRLEAVRADFNNFKARVKADADAQIAMNKITVANQERVSRETAKSYDARINAVLDRYKRLLNSPKSGGGGVPAVPATTEPVDDTARSARLLEVLQAADIQTARLIELQEFVRSVTPKPSALVLQSPSR